MKVLLTTEVIYPGGAETFVLRLAKAYKQQGHDVHIFAFYKKHYHADIHLALAPDVKILWPEFPLNFLLTKMDGLFFKLNIDFKFRNNMIERSLKKVISDLKPDVIHSHLLKADRLSVMAADGHIPTITTIHGDYLQFDAKQKQNIPITILNYRNKAAKTLTSLAKIVCISDKQIDFLNAQFPEAAKNKVVKIYNGYEGVKPKKTISEQRKTLGIADDAFVFGMVSRGIAEKGWKESILAFLKLDRPNTHLIFIGESNHLTGLKEKYKEHTNIHFLGQSYEPLEWINIFDAGLLPSTYGSESLPTVIIEYLFCGKPVIGSDVGEIKNMIQMGTKHAGIVISAKDNKISVDELAAAMKTYLDDKTLYIEHRNNAPLCFTQFDMQMCTERYMNVYKEVIDKKH